MSVLAKPLSVVGARIIFAQNFFLRIEKRAIFKKSYESSFQLGILIKTGDSIRGNRKVQTRFIIAASDYHSNRAEKVKGTRLSRRLRV